MQYPLVILALLFSLGILLENLIKLAFHWLYFLACIFLAAYFLRPFEKFHAISFCFLTVLCGAILLQNASFLAFNHISRLTYYKSDNLVSLQGRVESPPEINNNRTVFVLRAQEVSFKAKKIFCCGKVLIRSSTSSGLNYGENVILRGHLSRLFSFGKNRDSYNKFLNRQGIYCQLFVLPKSKIEKLRQNTAFSLRKFSLELKTRLERIIFRHCSQLSAAIVDAMVLGEKKYIPDRVYNAMIKTGTVHILVVSGFNVGIVGFLLFLLLKLGKVPRKIRILLTCVLLIIYCFITGASNPVMRATIMGIIFLLSYLVRRDADIYSSCAIAAIAILAINPSQLFDIGFQLSFLSVICIVYISPKLKSILRLESIRIKPFRFLLEGFIVSLSAWLGTAGLIWYYFRIFSPVAVIANILVVPLATLITLCGLSIICASVISPLLAQLFVPATEVFVSLLLRVNLYFANLF